MNKDGLKTKYPELYKKSYKPLIYIKEWQKNQYR